MIRRKPIVSVCIPTYNRAELLKEAIESVVTQTFENFELIISDNASEDGTEGVVRDYDDKRVIYSRNSRNIGLRGNWNRCLTLSKGRYITILPDDDLMMPENLALKVEVLSKNEQVGLVHSKYHLIDEKGTIIKHNTNWGHGPERDCDAIEQGQNVLERMLLTFNLINAPTVMLRRACYEKLGGFTDRLRLAFDWEYWMRIAVYYDMAFLAKPVIKWRIHSRSQTSQYAHAEGNMLTIVAFQEELSAKRLILKTYFHEIVNSDNLKRLVWHQMKVRILERAETMLGESGPNLKLTRFLVNMCRRFPEILLDKRIWKALLKSLVTAQMTYRLKRIRSAR